MTVVRKEIYSFTKYDIKYVLKLLLENTRKILFTETYTIYFMCKNDYVMSITTIQYTTYSKCESCK